MQTPAPLEAPAAPAPRRARGEGAGAGAGSLEALRRPMLVSEIEGSLILLVEVEEGEEREAREGRVNEGGEKAEAAEVAEVGLAVAEGEAAAAGEGAVVEVGRDLRLEPPPPAAEPASEAPLSFLRPLQSPLLSRSLALHTMHVPPCTRDEPSPPPPKRSRDLQTCARPPAAPAVLASDREWPLE